MFGVTGSYFAANLDAKTFLDPETAHLANCFGAALSFMCLLMTFFSSLAQTDLLKACFKDSRTPKLSPDFARLWAGMEQKIRDTSLLVLFSLVSLGSGMKTTETFAVVAMVSIFLGRQTAKYFDIQQILDDKYESYDEVTWVQNGLSCILFTTAFVTEYMEGSAVDLIDYLIGIAGLVQLILLISKRFSPEPLKRRMVFEETVGSLYHFIVLGSLLSRVSKSTQLISVAAVVIADFASRTQVLDATGFVGDKVGTSFTNNVGKVMSQEAGVRIGTKLLVTRVALLSTSAVAAVGGVLLFDKAPTGREASLTTLAMVAGVLKSLNSIAFLLDSRTTSYKSVYNFVSNGCTSLLLLTSSILLGMHKTEPKGLTVVLFCAALASRIVDMVQNAYASPQEEDTKMYTSSIDDEIAIDSAGITNFRAIMVFILLVVSAASSYVGLADLCPDFITATVDADKMACSVQDDVNIMLSYFSMITGHAILGLIAFIVAGTDLNRYIALSTVEIPRVLVSSGIIVLGGLVLGLAENTILTLSFVLYVLADGLGMSLM
jgi:hypothetical protein